MPASRILSTEAAQALADVVAVLLCGEGSAEFAFAHVAADLTADIAPMFRTTLERISDDERRHGEMLAGLRESLPLQSRREISMSAAQFLRGLATDDLALHLTRIAALDSAVCAVLAASCRPGTALSQDPALLALFNEIRRDEGRHVRVSRQCAAALGIDALAEGRESRAVLSGFAELLGLQKAALAVLGVDHAILQRRFEALGRFRRPASKRIAVTT